jgi:hypothetical protein
MEIQHPFRVVTPTLDGDVLSVLASATAEFTPPEVQRLIGDHSVDGVRRALARLVDQGVVGQQRSGNATRYWLNRDHLAAPAIIELATLQQQLIDRLRGLIESWAVPCEYAALFGSAVRGTMTRSSDIDVFIVRSSNVDPESATWTGQTTAAVRAVAKWTGNDARILELDIHQATVGLVKHDPVLTTVRDEGIWLAGPIGYLRGPQR